MDTNLDRFLEEAHRSILTSAEKNYAILKEDVQTIIRNHPKVFGRLGEHVKYSMANSSSRPIFAIYFNYTDPEGNMESFHLDEEYLLAQLEPVLESASATLNALNHDDKWFGDNFQQDAQEVKNLLIYLTQNGL